MSEWLTYSLSDFLLFSPRAYYRLFELYNRAVWPAQIPALLLGFALIALQRQGGAAAGRAAAAILAAAWLWVAWAYHLQRYATINWTARYLAMAFAAEALLFLWFGLLRARLSFGAGGWPARVGTALALLGLAHPAIAPAAGRPWQQGEVFGLMPDPTVVVTLGLLLAGTGGAARPLLFAIPLLWCAFSGATAWAMHSPDALVLPIAGVTALVAAAAGGRRR